MWGDTDSGTPNKDKIFLTIYVLLGWQFLTDVEDSLFVPTGWATRAIWTFWRREQSLATTRIRTQDRSLIAMPTALLWLLDNGTTLRTHPASDTSTPHTTQGYPNLDFVCIRTSPTCCMHLPSHSRLFDHHNEYLAKLHRETVIHIYILCSAFWLCWTSVGFNIVSCNSLLDLYCHSRISGSRLGLTGFTSN
jgi:hypothetical protein